MFETYTRKPFDVQAVQVTLENAEEIAREVGGRVEMIDYKVAGTKAKLPCVQIPGKGDRRGEEIPAPIGHWVVAMAGTFRVYKDRQFEASFEMKIAPEELAEARAYIKSDLEATLSLFHATQTDEAPSFFTRPTDLSRHLSSMGNRHSVNGELTHGVLEDFVKSATFEKDNWVEVVSEISVRHKQVGYVVETRDHEGLVVVQFPGDENQNTFATREIAKISPYLKDEGVRVKNPKEHMLGWQGYVAQVTKEEADVMHKVVFPDLEDHGFYWYTADDIERFVRV